MVLDEEHRELEPVTRPLDEGRQQLDLLVAEPAGGLVEEEQAGPADQGAGELDPLRGPVRKPGRGPVGDVIELHVRERLVSRLAHGALPERSRPRVRADEHVVEDGHRRKELNVLERARDAPAHDPVRGRAEEALAVEDDLAGIGPVEPGDDVESGRLPRAVGADQPGDLTLLDVERQLGERDDAAEAARDVL